MTGDPEDYQQLAGQNGGHYSFCSQYIAINLPEAILERLAGKQDFDDFEDSLLYSRIHHEFCHYIQNATTSYGLLKTTLLRLAGSSFFEGYVHFNKSGKPVSPQFDDQVPRKFTDPQSEYWPFVVGHNLIQILDAFENQVEPPRSGYPIGANRPKGQANPFVNLNGNKRAITAGILLEFQAYAMQVYALDHMNIPKEHANFLVSKIHNNTHLRLPWALAAHVFNVEKGSPELHLALYELISIALSPKVNLAPDVIFADGRSDLDSGELVDWEYLHPGWRFQSLMDFIKGNACEVPSSEDSKRFAVSVAREMGWSSPTTTLKDTLQSACEWPNILDDFDANAETILKFANESDSSFSLQERWLINGGPRARGPRPKPVDDFTVHVGLLDACVQLQYSNEVFCPLCLSKEHAPGCPIDLLFSYLCSGTPLWT